VRQAAQGNASHHHDFRGAGILMTDECVNRGCKCRSFSAPLPQAARLVVFGSLINPVDVTPDIQRFSMIGRRCTPSRRSERRLDRQINASLMGLAASRSRRKLPRWQNNRQADFSDVGALDSVADAQRTPSEDDPHYMRIILRPACRVGHPAQQNRAAPRQKNRLVVCFATARISFATLAAVAHQDA